MGEGKSGGGGKPVYGRSGYFIIGHSKAGDSKLGYDKSADGRWGTVNRITFGVGELASPVFKQHIADKFNKFLYVIAF